MHNDQFFDNKKFISSREAARIAGYTHDYISKLCRYGKLNGKKIGHGWYVEEKSFLDYLAEAARAKQQREDDLAALRKNEYKETERQHPSISSQKNIPQVQEVLRFRLFTIRSVVSTVVGVLLVANLALTGLTGVQAEGAALINFAEKVAQSSVGFISSMVADESLSATSTAAQAAGAGGIVQTALNALSRIATGATQLFGNFFAFLGDDTDDGVSSIDDLAIDQPITGGPTVEQAADAGTAGAPPIVASGAPQTFTINTGVLIRDGLQVGSGADISGGLAADGPVTFSGQVQANGGIITNGANVNLGSGQIFASNLINLLQAGRNITISGPANAPIITARSSDSRGSSGASRFVDLTDTPDTITANALVHGNAAGDGVTQSGSLTFDGTTLSSSLLTLSGSGTSTIAGGLSISSSTASSGSGLQLLAIDCSASANGGKLTTDANGFVVCGDDDTGAGTDPGGADGQIQFNNGGSFGGAFGFVYDDSTNRVGIGTSSPSAKLSIWASSTDTGVVAFNVVDSASSTLFSVTDEGNVVIGGSGTTTASFYAAVLGLGSDYLTDFTGVGLQNLNGSLALDINGLTALNTPAADDTLAIYDADAGTIRKISRSDLLGGLQGALSYQGTWDANANNPVLSDATGTQGHYFVVSVEGTQDLGSGSIDFTVGDWVVHNGTAWEKLDSTDRFTALTDAPSSHVAKSIIYTNSAGTALVNSALFVFDGTNFGVGTSSPFATLSVSGSAYIGGNLTATGTLAVTGTGTSTFTGGIQAALLNVTGSATSTFANGIALSAGCFRMPDGSCLTDTDTDTGIVNIEGVTETTIDLDDVDDTNVTLAIATSTGNIEFSLGWLGTLSVARGGTGSSTPSMFLFGDGAGNLTSTSTIAQNFIDNALLRDAEIDTSAELAALITDETGSGALVFGTLPTLGGYISTASSTIIGGLTVVDNATTTGVIIVQGTGTSTFTGGIQTAALDVTGSATSTFAGGLQISSGCYARPDGTCLGIGDGITSLNGSAEGIQTFATSSPADDNLSLVITTSGGVHTFSSTWTGTLAASRGGTGTSSPSGFLFGDGSNIVSSTTISVVNGGTGLATAPSYGQVLLGNANGGYTLTATSSLGLGNNTYLGLSDTPDTFTANAIQFANSGATALTQNSNFVFANGSLGVGTSSPTSRLTIWTSGNGTGNLAFNIVDSASTTIFSVADTGSTTIRGPLTVNTLLPSTFTGSVTISGLATFSNGFISGASSTVLGNFTSTGNLSVTGTGTSTFAGDVTLANLDVSGYTRLNGMVYNWPSTQNANYVLTTDGNGTLTWEEVAGIGGVGDITAVGEFTSGAAFADATADDMWFGLGATAGRFEFDDQTIDELTVLDAYLGLGTTSPFARLSVAGDTYLGGNLTATGTLAVTGTGTSTFAGDVSLDNLKVTGYTTLNGQSYNWPSTQNADYVLVTDGAGNLTWEEVTGVGSTGDVQAVGDCTSGLCFTGSGATSTTLTFDDNNGDGVLSIADLTAARTWTLPDLTGTFALLEGSQTFTGTKTFSNSTYSALFTGGSVGIGTTSPFARLSVAGDTYLGGNLTATGTLAVTGTGTSTFAGGLDIGSGNLVVDSSSGNVGVGTSSPTAGFAVSGNAYITGGLGIGAVRTTEGLTLASITSCSGSTALQTDANGGVVCGAIASLGVSSAGGWSTNSQGDVTLSTTSDRVGIGATTTSYAKLSVLSGNAATTTLALVPTTGQTANIIDIYDDEGNLTSVFTADHFLGLGTTSPFAKLSVSGGDAYIGGNLTATGTLAVTGTGTSTFTGGIQTAALDVTGSATSTFANGIALSAGCFRMPDGSCLSDTDTGITNLNGLTALSQTFATSSDTNVGLTITSSGSVHTFTSTWTGTLDEARGGTGTSSPSQFLFGNGTDIISTSTIARNYLDSAVILSDEIDTYNELNTIVADVTLTHNGLIDTSAEIAAIVTDETGSGALVFATNPTLNGFISTASSTIAGLTVSGNSTTTGNIIVQGTGTSTFAGNIDATGDIEADQFFASGSGTSTFVGGIQAALLNVTGSATSTFANGIDISSGCFSVNGSCIDLSSTDNIAAGTQGQIAFYDANGTAIEGTSTITITQDGKVGIGTTSPTEDLSVAGDLYVGGTGISTFAGGLVVETSGLVYDSGTNRVGIGTAAPGATLDVNGSVRFDDSVTIWDGNANKTSSVAFDDSSDAILTLTAINNGADAQLIVHSDGYVYFENDDVEMGRFTSTGLGIGTSSPFAKLSVSGGDAYIGGNLTATGTLAVTGTGTSTFAGGLSVAGSLDIDGSATSTFANGIDLSAGCFSVNGTCLSGADGTGITAIGPSGQTQTGATITFATSSLDTDTGLSLGLTIVGAGDTLTFTPSLSGTLAAGFGGTGTSSPSGFLFGDGSNIVSSTTISVVNGGTGLATAPSYGQVLLGNANGGYTLTATSSLGITSSQWITSGSNIYYSAGNVGIGTSSPFAKLSVAGDTVLDSNLIILGSSTASTLTLNYAAKATSTIVSGSDYAWTIATSTGSLPIIAINTSSSTGKATTSITGGFSIDGGALEYDYTTGVTSIDNVQLGFLSFEDNAGVVGWIDLPVSTTTTGLTQSYTAYLDDNPMLTVYGITDGSGGVTSRYLGVGTTSPSAKLTVWGDVSNTGAITFNVMNSASTTLFAVSDTGSTTIAGQLYVATSTATSTFVGGLSAGSLSVTGSATSTFANGIDLSAGCFSISGSCIDLSSTDNIAAGTQGQIAFYDANGTAIEGTSTITITQDGLVGVGSSTPYAKLSVAGNVVADYFHATSTTATSTFAGNVTIGGNSVYAKNNSIAFGGQLSGGTISASGVGSIAGGNSRYGAAITASGNGAVGLGFASQQNNNGEITASADGSVAIGYADGQIISSGLGSVAIGVSPSVGNALKATGQASVALGEGVQALQNNSFALGKDFINNTADTFQIGFSSTPTLTVNSSAVAIGTSSPSARLTVWAPGTSGATAFNVINSASTTLFTVLDNGYLGIGTTSPFAALSVAGNAVLDSNLITFGSSTASTLTLNYAAKATSTIVSGSNYAWTIATSTGSLPIISINTASTTGKATTTIVGGFVIDGGALQYDYTTGVTSIDNIELGFLQFEDNAGVVGWVDLPVSTTTTGLTQSYTALLDGNPMLTIWGVTDGSGGIGNGRIAIGTSTPSAKLTVWSGTTTNEMAFNVVNSASTTLFGITSTGSTTLAGQLYVATSTATSTFVGGLSAGSLSVTGSATSTFANGIDLSAGCFSISGSCIDLSSTDNIAAGTQGQVAFYDANGSAIEGTSTITITQDGKVGIGSTTPSRKLTVTGDGYFDGDVYASSFTATSSITVSKSGIGALSVTGSGSNEGQYVATISNSGSGQTGALLVSNSSTGIARVIRAVASGSGNTGRALEVENNSASGWGIYSLGSSPNYFNGNVVIGTTSPSAKLTVWASGTSGATAFNVVNSASTTLFTVLDNGYLGIGTSSPFAALSVAGNTVFDSNLITFGSSTATTLTLNYAAKATSTIVDGSDYAWTIATSTTATPILSINTSGSGKATTSINGGFVVDGGAIEYDYSSGITSIDNLEIGPLLFGTDAGMVSWVDMPVSTTTAGIVQSYTAQLDGNPMITVYGVTDGSGGVGNPFVGIGTTTPSAKLTVASGTTTGQMAFNVVNSASTTLFGITSTGSTTIAGQLYVATSTATSTFVGGLSAGSLSVTGSATSTFANGIDLSAGCFSVSGSCIDLSSTDNIAAGTQGQIAFYDANGTAIEGTSTITIADTGKVAIGSGTNPNAQLHIYASSSVDTGLEIDMDALASTAVSIERAGSSTGTFYSFSSEFSATNRNGYLKLSNLSSSGETAIWQRVNNFDSVLASDYTSSERGRTYFELDGATSPVLTITTELDNLDGAVGVGTSSPYAKLTVWSSTTTDLAAFNVVNSASTTLFSILSSGNVGIGTTSPYAALSVAGAASVFDTSLIQFGSSTASTLSINYAAKATSTIVNGSDYAWTIATSTTATPILSINTSGSGKATTSINGGFVVDGGAIEYDYGSGITSIDNLEIGPLSFDSDSGIISWVDMLVSTTTTGIVNSYTAQLDGNPMITVYGVTDGSGGVGSQYVGIGTTSPSAKLTVWSGTTTNQMAFNVVNSASTTLFGVTSTGSTTIAGQLYVATSTATSTFVGGLTAGTLSITSTSATSTFANGIDLSGGCFSVNGTCLSSGGSGTVNSGTQGQVAFYNSAGTALSGTSSLTIDTDSQVTVNTGLSLQGTGSLFQPAALSIGEIFPTVTTFDGIKVAVSHTPSANATRSSGVYVDLNFDGGSNVNTDAMGVRSTLTVTGSGTTTNAYGGRFEASHDDTGTTTNLYGIYAQADNSAFAGNVTNAYGVYATISQGGSNITNGYGLYVPDVSATTDYAIYTAGSDDDSYFAGNVGIGTTSPYAKLSVVGQVVAEYFTATGTATSTLTGGLSASTLDITSTTATSTFANGIQLSGGCFRDASGSCVGGGAASAGSQSATYVVAAYNSVGKDYADYVADYSNDEVEINQAITAASAVDGGIVYLLEGDFIVGTSTSDGDAIVMASSTTLMGTGDGTRITVASSTPGAINVVAVRSARDSRVAGLYIDGNEANQSFAIQRAVAVLSSESSTIEDLTATSTENDSIYVDSSSNIVIDNVRVGNSSQEGIEISNSSDTIISNSVVENSSGYGIYVSGGEHNVLAGTVLKDSGTYGLQLFTDRFTVTDSVFDNGAAQANVYVSTLTNGVFANNMFSNASVGINFDYGGENVTVEGNTFYANGNGVTVAGSTAVVFDGNTFTSNTGAGISAVDSVDLVISDNVFDDNGGSGASDAISISSGNSDLIISGNRITDTAGSGYAIDISSGSSGVVVADNLYSGTGAASIRDQATDTRYTQHNRLTVNATDSDFSAGAYTALNVTQSGTGDIVNLFDGSTEVFTVLDGGNVGIGTTSPYAKLSVVGEVVASHFTATSTTATSTIAGGLAIETSGFVYDYSSNQVGIGTAAPSAKLDVSRNDGLGTDLLLEVGTDYLAINDSGAVMVGTTTNLGGDFNVEGLTALRGASTVDGLLTVETNAGNEILSINNKAGSAAMVLADQTTGTNDVLRVNDINDNRLFVVNDAGNVGIGTTSPYAKLSVVGEVVGSYFTSTSTTATSTFANHISIGAGKEYRINGVGVLTRASDGSIVLGKLGFGSNGTGALDLQSDRLPGDIADGTRAVAVGVYNYAGTGDVALGYGNTSSAEDSGSPGNASAVGVNNTASGLYSSAFGFTNSVTADFASAFGSNITNNVASSLMIGPSDAAKITILSSGNVGIGTTSPFAKLSVVGNTVLDSNLLILGSSTASSLTLNYAAAATSTIVSGNSFAFTIATSTGASPIFAIDTSSTTGYATTSITGGFSVNNGAIHYDHGANITSIERLNLGPLSFDTDAGVVSWIDLPVTSSAPASTTMSYSAQIDSNAVLTIYGVSDGSGGATDLRVGIGTTTPYAKLSVADGNIAVSGCIEDAESGTDIGGTCVDIAETYPVGEYVLPGEILKVGTTSALVKAESAEDMLGIVSTRPAVSLEGYNAFFGGSNYSASSTYEAGSRAPIALAGRVPVKVNLEGGDILPGDRITLSSEAGVGTKATTSGHTIGIALDSFDEDDADGMVTVYVDPKFSLIESEFFLSGGKLGLGTLAPTSKLTVAGGVEGSYFTSTSTQASSLGGALSLGGTLNVNALNSTSTIAGNLYVQGVLLAEDTRVGDLAFANGFRFTEREVLGTTTPHALELQNQFGSTTFAVDTEGNVFIGTTTEGYKVAVGGDIAATGFVNISLESSKTDIEHLTTEDTADILDTIEGVQIAQYRYKDEDQSNPLRLGLIAEEAPTEVLSVEGDGVDLYKLSTFTLAGVQELAKEFRTLELRVAALEEGRTGGVNAEGFFDLVGNALRSMRVKFVDGVVNMAAVIAQNLTIGTKENPTGFTIYDEVTGEPYCVKMHDGKLTPVEGECELVGDATLEADLTTPYLKLEGDSPLYLEQGDAYEDEGVSTTSAAVGTTTMTYFVNDEEVEEVEIDTDKLGTYRIAYVILDSAGHIGTTTRTVVVREAQETEEEEMETPEVIDMGASASSSTSTPSAGTATSSESTSSQNETGTSTPESTSGGGSETPEEETVEESETTTSSPALVEESTEEQESTEVEAAPSSTESSSASESESSSSSGGSNESAASSSSSESGSESESSSSSSSGSSAGESSSGSESSSSSSGGSGGGSSETGA